MSGAGLALLALIVVGASGALWMIRLSQVRTGEGRVFVIEINATPDITYDEDFAASADAAGMSYPQLLQRILMLGLRYEPPWRDT